MPLSTICLGIPWSSAHANPLGLQDDYESIQQHAVSSITDCQVQMLAHRKQGPVLPTLVVNVSPDPATDKLRKRRSSRTVGLTSTKDTSPTTLWFRLVSGDKESSLQDWARFIRALIQPNVPDRPPMSPLTPASPTFINPFSSRGRETIEPYPRPSSGNANLRAALQHKGSTHTTSSRDRPLTFSESTSLRSKRSDISSHTSSMNPPYVGFQNYTTMHPTDLPSPATTIGEYQGEFIEGWTSAQGRSSTLSSPVRGRDSIGSQPALSAQVVADASSPPGPRETILDRAFQMRCIPGSEREVPGEEKLSSLARFDALMREADEKRKMREAEAAKLREANNGMKSAWDLDDEDSESDNPEEDDDNEDSDEDDDAASEQVRDPDDHYMMPPTARRALDYITGRREPRTQDDQAPLRYNPETLMTLNSGSSHLRPQTGYSRNRPGIAQRTHSQPHLVGITSAVAPSILDLSSRSPRRPSEDESAMTTAKTLERNTAENRGSTSSVKRLSFNEFAKRLSSTSSLLLMQTNASSTSANSSRNSEAEPQQHAARGTLSPRGAPPTPVAERDSPDKRCAWRGSVGVFGGEGGFV